MVAPLLHEFRAKYPEIAIHLLLDDRPRSTDFTTDRMDVAFRNAGWKQAALDGQGLAQLAAYQACDHLRSGALVSCLARHAPNDRGHFIWHLSQQNLPSRTRVFVDFMTAQIRAPDLHCLSNFSADACVPARPDRLIGDRQATR